MVEPLDDMRILTGAALATCFSILVKTASALLSFPNWRHNIATKNMISERCGQPLLKKE